jgi:hypothetical protein
VRWSQQVGRATAEVNPRGRERATARAGRAEWVGRGMRSGSRKKQAAQTGRAERAQSGTFGGTDARFVALPLKKVHDEILAQY